MRKFHPQAVVNISKLEKFASTDSCKYPTGGMISNLLGTNAASYTTMDELGSTICLTIVMSLTNIRNLHPQAVVSITKLQTFPSTG